MNKKNKTEIEEGFFDRNPGHKELKNQINEALALDDKDFHDLIYDVLKDDYIPLVPEEIVLNGHKMTKYEYMKHLIP